MSLTGANCPAINLKIGEKQKHFLLVVGYIVVLTTGTLSNDDDYGSKNITRKMDFVPFQTLSRLFGIAQFVKCRRLFLELNSEGLYPRSNREEKNCRCMSTSSTERCIGTFHVEVYGPTVGQV